MQRDHPHSSQGMPFNCSLSITNIVQRVAKVVKLCLEKGADITAVTRDAERENGLILACRNNVYSDVLELLLNHSTSGMLRQFAQ
jgi:hypothetical protein